VCGFEGYFAATLSGERLGTSASTALAAHLPKGFEVGILTRVWILERRTV
jgi:hypothetical protein